MSSREKTPNSNEENTHESPDGNDRPTAFENLEPEIEDYESESDEIGGGNDDRNGHDNKPNVENNMGESHETRDSTTSVNNPITIENPEVITTPDASILQDATSGSVL
ncbi:hypothetical protein L6452_37342 [Arctium lappa]|uniref:Uncharacterized protein n=1 Tax=Arctium lappa TaxID=4217 RepID=A0ACB8Y1Z7_ARCLA|nr:hypothetical protein L6452_37342 [Arctium lappa]